MPMPDRDECRPVTLPSGEAIPVLGARELSPADVAAMGELVEAVRRKAAAGNPPDPDAAALGPGSTWRAARPTCHCGRCLG
jgi:hypothetical protein